MFRLQLTGLLISIIIFLLYFIVYRYMKNHHQANDMYLLYGLTNAFISFLFLEIVRASIIRTSSLRIRDIQIWNGFVSALQSGSLSAWLYIMTIIFAICFVLYTYLYSSKIDNKIRN